MKRHISIFTFLLCVFAVAATSAAEVLMRVEPIGFRVGAEGTFEDFSESAVRIVSNQERDIPIATSNEPVRLTAVLNKDYKLIGWQKFNDDPQLRTGISAMPFGEGQETVSFVPEAGIDWLYVAVVVEYNPRRTVKADVSSFGKGTVTISPTNEVFKPGDVVTLTATSAEGHSFVRWSDGNADHTRELIVGKTDIDLTAFIEPDSCKVSFSPGEGAVLDETEKRVSYGSYYGALPTPRKTGAEFSGWTDSEKRTVKPGTSVSRVDDHTLFAVWSSALFEIGWKTIGEGNGKVDGTGTYAYGSQPTLTAVPYEGSDFAGWADGETRNPRRIVVLSNATYIAEFDIRKYSVTFSYKTGSEGKTVKVGPYLVNHGESVPDTDIPSNETVDRWDEHTFKTWSTEEYKRVTRDLSVEAIYDLESYLVRFSYCDSQGNCVTTMPQHVASGGKAVPPDGAVANNWTGHTLKGWQPDYNTICSDTLCEAIYETNEYAIVFCYCNAKGKEVQHKEIVLFGEEIPFAFVDSQVNLWPGHTFKHWDMNGKTVEKGVVATHDAQIVAVYEGYSRITFNSGKGGGEMAPQVFTNFSGEATLNANSFTNTGYTFAHWTDPNGVSYKDGATIEVTEGENIDLTAQWDPIKYTIYLDPNGGQSKVKGNPKKNVDYGEEVEFEISAGQDFFVTRDGYDLLSYWSRDAVSTNEIYMTRGEEQKTLLVVSNLTTVAGETVTLYAQWKGKDQEVTINGKKQSIPYGSELKQPADPAPWTGHTFTREWTTNGVDTVSFPITVTGSFNLKPIWTTNTYSVSFHGTDGTYDVDGTMVEQSFTYDVSQALTSNGFTRASYAFANWTNATGTAFADGAVVKNLATNDGAVVDLYATWDDRRSYTVRFNPKDGEGTPYFQVMRCGKPMALDANRFAQTGYGFAGWGDGGDTVAYTNGEVVTDLAAENGTNDLYAVWTPNQYWVAFEPNGGTGEMSAQAFTYDVAQALSLNEFTKTGHAFTGWATNEADKAIYADGAVVSNLTDVANATNTLWASWTVNSYKVRYEVDGAIVAVQTNKFGSTFTAPVVPTKEGFTLAGWTLNGDEFNVGTTTMPAGDIVLVAVWSENGHYTVRFNGNGGTTTGGLAAYNQDFTLDVAQALKTNDFIRTGHDFLNWTNEAGICYADGATVTNLAAESEVSNFYAVWQIHTHELVWIDGEIVDRKASVAYGTELPDRESLSSRKGYVFTGWSTNGTVVSLPMPMPDHDLTLEATWRPAQYKIAFDGNGADVGTAMDPIDALYDQGVELPSNRFVRTGYSFVGWAKTSEGAKIADDGATVKKNLTDNDGTTVTLYALWVEEKGNDLSIALGLPGNFITTVSAEGAWTIVGAAKQGLKREYGYPDGTLVLDVPSNGTLTFSFDADGSINCLSISFNNNIIKTYNLASVEGETITCPETGKLVFMGTPDDGETETWKLYNFTWTPAK